MAETVEDLDALRKCRGPFLSAITRIKQHFQTMEDDEDPATYDLTGVTDRLASLEATRVKGQKKHDLICAIETAEETLAHDEQLRENFKEHMD